MLRVPFYPNSKDDTRCVQACLRSILKFYFPERDYSFRYLDRVTVHKEGKWTWSSAMLLFLAKLGFEVIDVGDLDYRKFAKGGERYLRRVWPAAIFEMQKKFSDLKNEQRLVRQLLQQQRRERRVKLINRSATIADLRAFFRRGFIVLCGGVNPYVLDRKDGYASHMVLITDLDKKGTIAFHDPGLPPRRNRRVPLKRFLRAWRYPTRDDASLIAVRLKSLDST